MSVYKVIDHPSDIGMESYGNDMKELFSNSAFGMMDMIFDLSKTEASESFNIKVSADDIESLLVAWLSELIYLSDSKKVAFSKFTITKMSDKQLEATALGGKISGIKRNIKAVTFSQLEIKKEKDGYSAKVIFDV